jgi:hypothetical protein
VIDPGASVIGSGDFDGNGYGDLLWRTRTGEVLAWVNWSPNPSSYSELRLGNPGSNWQLAGVGDFDGDMDSDVLWREAGTGALYLWNLHGIRFDYCVGGIVSQGYTDAQADERWSVAGIGDFDGDGKSDILWRNVGGPDTGALFVWLMDGTAVKGATYLDPISTDWQVQGLGDFNGDAKTDILWRNRNAAAGDAGFLYVWMMDGPTVIAGTGYTAAQADFSWQVQIPR